MSRRGRKNSGTVKVYGPYPHRGGFVLEIRDPGGARAIECFETEAEANRRAKLLKVAAGVDLGRTVGKTLEDYEKYQRIDKGNKERSVTTTQIRLRGFFTKGDLELQKLTPTLVAGYYRAQTGTRAVDTHRGTLSEARTFLAWCVKRGWLHENPLEKVEGVGRRRTGKQQLTIEEARKFTTTALTLAGKRKGDLGALAAALPLLTGMRASEITNLRRRDLDDGGTILWVQEGKTEAARRRFVVPEVISPLLLKVARRLQPDGLLFGNHWRDWPRENVQRICRLAGLPEVTAHGLRGTHATLAEGAGATGVLVAQALGHEHVSTTHKHYTLSTVVKQATQERALRVIAGGRRAH
jgi:integrase